MLIMRQAAWNDGADAYLFDNRGDASNRLRIYKNTSNQMVLEYTGQGTAYSTTMDVSALVVGTWYNFVFQVDTKNKVDVANSYYLKIYRDYTVATAGSTTQPVLQMVTVGSTHSVGSDYAGANQWNGLIANLIVEDVIWQDSIANAATAGMPECQSVQWNSVPNRPVCTNNTRFMLGLR